MRIRNWKAAVLGLALALLTGAVLLASQSLDVDASAPAGSADSTRGQYRSRDAGANTRPGEPPAAPYFTVVAPR